MTMINLAATDLIAKTQGMQAGQGLCSQRLRVEVHSKPYCKCLQHRCPSVTGSV